MLGERVRGVAVDVTPEQVGLSIEGLERITHHLETRYIQPAKIAGCQALVARHGHVAYFRSFGSMDRERGKPMADDTIFRIYSMTKPITSVALMMLHEQGAFQLNDPVARFIPEWEAQQVYVSGEGQGMQTRAPKTPMTVRHLLSHSGGLSYGGTDHPVDQVYQREGVRREAGETLQSFVKKLARVPLRFDPGEGWLYSLSTDVCGYLVEALSGEPFDQYLRRHIFEPLGMSDTAFAVAPEKVERFAANYRREQDRSLTLIDDPATSSYRQQPSFLSGGGGLTSTTADYLRFCEMLRRGGELDGVRILGPRTLRLMTQNHLAGGRGDLKQMAVNPLAETASYGVGFGLGFATTVSEVAAGTLGECDFYWSGAASTIFWVDPREDLLVIFMTQLMPSATFNFRGQLKSIVYSAIVD